MDRKALQLFKSHGPAALCFGLIIMLFRCSQPDPIADSLLAAASKVKQCNWNDFWRLTYTLFCFNISQDRQNLELIAELRNDSEQAMHIKHRINLCPLLFCIFAHNVPAVLVWQVQGKRCKSYAYHFLCSEFHMPLLECAFGFLVLRSTFRAHFYFSLFIFVFILAQN